MADELHQGSSGPTEMPERAFRASAQYQDLRRLKAEVRAEQVARLRDGAIDAATSVAAGRPSARGLKEALAATTGGLRLAINVAGLAVGGLIAFMALRWGGLV